MLKTIVGNLKPQKFFSDEISVDLGQLGPRQLSAMEPYAGSADPPGYADVATGGRQGVQVLRRYLTRCLDSFSTCGLVKIAFVFLGGLQGF